MPTNKPTYTQATDFPMMDWNTYLKRYILKVSGNPGAYGFEGSGYPVGGTGYEGAFGGNADMLNQVTQQAWQDYQNYTNKYNNWNWDWDVPLNEPQPVGININSPPYPPNSRGEFVPPTANGGGASQQLPQTGGRPIAGGTPVPTTPTQPTVDPYAYFAGTSPYGHYASQVAEGYNPSQLPRLKVPSMQTWLKMGPQFQQQYYGYKQAQTGAIPEQSNWNIMRLSPPSGTSAQLSYRR